MLTIDGSLTKFVRIHGSNIILLVVVALWPFANFYSANFEQIDHSALSALQVGLVTTIVLVSSSYIIVAVVGGHPRSAFVATSVVTVLHFLMQPLLKTAIELPPEFKSLPLVIYVFLSAGLFWLGLRRSLEFAFSLTAMFVVVATLYPVVVGAAKVYQLALAQQQIGQATGSGIGDASFSRRPNVYFFLSDGHPDVKQSKAVLGYDASPFFNALKQLDFVIPDSSRANYPLTFLSLASTLSMEYLVTEDKPYSTREPFYRILRGDNVVFKRFRREGYKIVRFEPGAWPGSECQPDEQDCIKAGTPLLNVVQQTFWQETFLPDVLRLLVSPSPTAQVDSYPHGITTASDVKRYLQNTRPFSPFFIMVHSLPPHGPWIYQEDCSIAPKRDSSVAPGRLAERMARETRCTDDRIRDLSRHIVDTDPGAIIILQSDHGTSVHTPFDARNWTKAQADERFSILNAWKLPEDCRKLVYSGMSAVNTFRIVFACLEGRGPVLLDDISYIAHYEGHPRAGTVVRIPH